MATTVLLPPQFGSPQLYRFVRNVIDQHGRPVSDGISFDFGHLRFIDGVGLTVFCNTLEWLRKRNVHCHFTGYSANRESIKYLDDCGFFVSYLAQPLRASATVRATTLPFIPFQRVEPAYSFGWIELQAIPWLASRLKTSEDALSSVGTSMKEIFNNILDHSDENIGCVHVQHYPQIDRIEITVSDFGKGIPANINARFGSRPDGEAIDYATREGVTTGGPGRNAGAGLSVLIDYVTGVGGDVTIYSRAGGVRCSQGRNGGVRRALWVGQGLYPGTLFNIGLRTDTFESSLLEREAFTW